MINGADHQFSGPVTVFHERRLPEQATPAGYAALIHAYRLKVPIPLTLSATGSRHKVLERDGVVPRADGEGVRRQPQRLDTAARKLLLEPLLFYKMSKSLKRRTK